MTAIVYTTTTCAFCPGVKKYLKSKGIAFTEKNAEEPEVLKEIMKLSGVATVPQTLINNQVIVGPNYGKIAEALNG